LTSGLPLRRLAAALLCTALALLVPRRALAQEAPRPAGFDWDHTKRELFVSVSYRDVVDEEIRRKLSRGLPTTIVFTGTLFRRGVKAPVSTTVQTCKITWHVWDEAYRLEITRPEGTRTRWTTTLEGVLRRCAEAGRLLAGTAKEVAPGQAVSLRVRIQVNPVSPEILEKIKLWVSRPTRTATAAPGDALFSTFTGLFMQRIGEAERILDFTTEETVPRVEGAPKSET
jgi:hypothetical protein